VTPCPGARIVAVLDGAVDAPELDCGLGGAVPAQWHGVRLFERGSPGVAALDQPAPGELRRYCSYEWTGAGEPELDALLAVLEASPVVDGDTLGLDCGEARGRGELDPGLERALHASFRQEIGRLSASDLGPDQALRTPIEVAVVDTVSARAAADPALEPGDPHGVAMAAIIADITCPDERQGCAARIRHALALPRSDPAHAPDWVRGGRRGTSADVALAIYEAVERWRRRGDAPHLVINASIGWQRVEPGRGPDRALQASLEYAACRGALVFAAAGNGGDPRCETSRGALTPASFEEVPAPDAAKCRAYGVVPEDAAGLDHAQPLVHAVGAVDRHDRPLATARVEGQARLVAAASQGLARTHEGEYTTALSGSSVSTAVVSGAAALVWSYHPQLRPDELVELLYRGGRALPLRSDFGASDRPAEVRRVFVCAALELACREHPSDACPVLDCAAQAATSEDRGELVRAAVDRRRAARPDGVRVHRGSTRTAAEPVCPDSDLAAALGR
jgi:subtilisin family serine protease